MYKILVLAIWVFLAFGCSGNADSKDLIDYEELKEVKIEFDIQINESSDYLPGILRDLIVFSDGSMLVSDWGSNSIEQFDYSGNHVATIAEKGGGPGELSNFFLLFDGGYDTLIVRHRGMSRQIDQFSKKSGNGIFAHSGSIVMEELSDRYVTFLEKRTESEYYALAPRTIRNLPEASIHYPNYTHSPVVIVDKFERILRDSLHLLKIPNPITVFNQGSMFVIGMPPYQSHDRFRLLNSGGYLIARPDSSAIYFFNKKHNLEDVINFKIKPRPVKKIDLEYKLRDISKAYHNNMLERIPDYKPSFLNTWASKNHIMLHTDSSDKGKEMVVLTMKGELIGKFYLSEFDEVRYFRNNQIYTIHKDPMGHSIRVYQVFL